MCLSIILPLADEDCSSLFASPDGEKSSNNSNNKQQAATATTKSKEPEINHHIEMREYSKVNLTCKTFADYGNKFNTTRLRILIHMYIVIIFAKLCRIVNKFHS